jgi:ribose-phosphate pyrophosphokinase
LKTRTNLLLVGPDAESEQWVSGIAGYSGHPFVIGAKQRLGDRRVEVTLPDISEYSSHTAVIIDDVISSGQTILQCIETLKKAGIHSIQCVAVHGIFADGVDADLMSAGLESLVTSNTIGHRSNAIDIAPLLIDPINSCLNSQDK